LSDPDDVDGAEDVAGADPPALDAGAEELSLLEPDPEAGEVSLLELDDSPDAPPDLLELPSLSLLAAEGLALP